MIMIRTLYLCGHVLIFSVYDFANWLCTKFVKDRIPIISCSDINKLSKTMNVVSIFSDFNMIVKRSDSHIPTVFSWSRYL